MLPGMNAKATPPDLAAIRARFPALAEDTIYLENAGGSQVPVDVANRMRDYMLRSYVQLDASYELSRRCTQTVAAARELVRVFVNAGDCGEVAFGSSTSALCRMLADAYADVLAPRDEIVVAEGGHEANVGPWLRLEREGISIRWWRVDPKTGRSTLDGLADVLSERTRLVAFPHVSNLVGEVLDVAAATRMAHEAGAQVVADGVAYAPHRAIDVEVWGVDWYVYSAYKVYGPHMAALFGRHEAFAALHGPNHFFVPRDAVPYKFELGGVNHEGCAGLLGLGDYLCFLAGHEAFGRQTVLDAAALWEGCERPLQERVLRWLAERSRLRVIGSGHGPQRVGTISFVHESRTSREIALAANARGIGIRHGHMYAHRLCTALGLDPDDGVVRISLVHYNAPEDIERCLAALAAVVD